MEKYRERSVEAVVSNEKTDKAVGRYIDQCLTPSRGERRQIQVKRNHVLLLLGRQRCEEVGSYARQTAIKPASDLDLLYKIETGADQTSSRTVLDRLAEQLEEGLDRPGQTAAEVRAKTCTVGIDFIDHESGLKNFSIEVVPAVPDSRNAGRTLYRVPKRPVETDNGLSGAWQISDPFYYSVRADRIETEINAAFRPAVRLAKGWLDGIKRGRGCPLRSFHLELIVGEVCLRHPKVTQMDLTALVEATFRYLPEYLRAAPYFLDPADKNRWNDGYLERIRENDPARIEEIVASAEEAAKTMADISCNRNPQEIIRRLNELTNRQTSSAG